MFYNIEIETMVVIFNNKNFRHKKARLISGLFYMVER